MLLSDTKVVVKQCDHAFIDTIHLYKENINKIIVQLFPEL